MADDTTPDPQVVERAARALAFGRLLRQLGHTPFPHAGLLVGKFGWSRRDAAAVIAWLEAVGAIVRDKRGEWRWHRPEGTYSLTRPASHRPDAA